MLQSGGAGLTAAKHLAEEIVRLEKPLTHGTDTILLAEDEEGVRSSTAEMLRTDVITPGIIDAQLRDARLPQRPNLKVFFMSGRSRDVLSTEGALGPSTHFIQKPFTMLSLVNVVRKVLDG